MFKLADLRIFRKVVPIVTEIIDCVEIEEYKSTYLPSAKKPKGFDFDRVRLFYKYTEKCRAENSVLLTYGYQKKYQQKSCQKCGEY